MSELALPVVGRRNSLNDLVCFCLAIYFQFCLLIETINGFAIYIGLSPVSMLLNALKFGIALCAVLYLAMNDRRMFPWALSYFLVITLLIVTQQVIGVSDDLRAVSICFKIFTNLFAVYYFYAVVLNAYDGLAYAKKAVLINFSVLAFNIFLSTVGIGFSNYVSGAGEGFGGTGFLYAGNEVGIALVLGFSAMLVAFYDNRIILLCSTVAALACAVLVVSKTSLLGIFILCSVYIFIRSRLLFLIGCGAVFTLALAKWSDILNYFEFAIKRWSYLIDQNGLSSFLLGGHKRVVAIEHYFAKVYDQPELLLVGLGWTGYSENNLFDLVEAFGIFGLFLFCVFAYILAGRNVLSKSCKNTTNAPAMYTSYAGRCLALFILIFAGHTIQSSLVVVFFGFLCNTMYFLLVHQKSSYQHQS